jgi:hypothetical protein
MPFDLAFTADDDFVLAWLIATGENNGRRFNWNARRWEDQ